MFNFVYPPGVLLSMGIINWSKTLSWIQNYKWNDNPRGQFHFGVYPDKSYQYILQYMWILTSSRLPFISSKRFVTIALYISIQIIWHLPSHSTGWIRKHNLSSMFLMTSSNWKMFPHYWPFARGIHWSSVNSPHKGQSRGPLLLSLICAWINAWVNNRVAGDLRRHCAHYDVTVMLNFGTREEWGGQILPDDLNLTAPRSPWIFGIWLYADTM